MSFYKMEITGTIGLTEYSDINDYFCIVESTDNLIIFVDNCTQGNLDMLNSLLVKGNFLISEKGHDKDGRFFVKVYKNLK